MIFKNDSGDRLMEKIKILKCGCGMISLPPSKTCNKCQSKTSIIEIESKGIVLSFTQLYVPPTGFTAPLGIALVELSENARIICNSTSEKKYEIGDEVTVSSENDHWYIIE
jgi:uncharacterized OB-fold protein